MLRAAVVDGLEVRYLKRTAKLDSFDGKLIRGMPIVFHSLSEDLGGFRERIKPSAVDRTLREGIDVRALVDHDSAKIMGRQSAGTLSLRKESEGLAAKIDPPDTSYARDILASIDRGDVTGMSFGFQVLTDDWHMEDGEAIREIEDMRIHEISIVTFPAYEATDVQVALRSLDRFRQETAWKPSAEFLKRQARLG